MTRLARLLAVLVLTWAVSATSLVLGPAGPASAARACPGFGFLTMEHQDAGGNVVATSSLHLDAVGGTGNYCAITTKVGSSVGTAHQITLRLWDEHNEFRESSGTYTSGGPIAVKPWLQRCARITVTMSELDGTVVFDDDSGLHNCVV